MNIAQALNDNQLSMQSILPYIIGLYGVTVLSFLLRSVPHAEVLDEALIRPGRIDLSVHISYITLEAFKDFVHVFYDNALTTTDENMLDAMHKIEKVTVAQLQNDFMRGMSAEKLMAQYGVVKTEHAATAVSLSAHENAALLKIAV